MKRKIHRYLGDDHRRLDGLLERAVADPKYIDGSAYAQFRAGLLKHIGMEKKFFFQRQKGGAAASPSRSRPGCASITAP